MSDFAHMDYLTPCVNDFSFFFPFFIVTLFLFSDLIRHSDGAVLLSKD